VPQNIITNAIDVLAKAGA